MSLTKGILFCKVRTWISETATILKTNRIYCLTRLPGVNYNFIRDRFDYIYSLHYCAKREIHEFMNLL